MRCSEIGPPIRDFVNKKDWTHHKEKPKMMCPIYFYKVFSNKKLQSGLLKAFLDSNCNSNSHTNHGVVTCADETHHFYVKVPIGTFGLLGRTPNHIYYGTNHIHNIILTVHDTIV